MQLMRKRIYLAQGVGIDRLSGTEHKTTQNGLISIKHRVSRLLRTIRIMAWQMLSY